MTVTALEATVATIAAASATSAECDERLAAMDLQLLLTALQLLPDHPTRARIARAIRRRRGLVDDTPSPTCEDHRAHRPVHVPIGRGATMVLWTLEE